MKSIYRIGMKSISRKKVYKIPRKILWKVEKLSAPYDADESGRVPCSRKGEEMISDF